MESRKRLRTEDGEVLQSKKRAVSDSRDSPVPINGLSDPNEPRDGDSLEVGGIQSWSKSVAIEYVFRRLGRMRYTGE